MNQKIYERYAKLLLRIGCDLRADEILIIQAPVGTETFVRELARAAYRYGAKYVQVDFQDPELEELRCRCSREKHLTFIPSWKAAYLAQRTGDNIAVIRLISPAVEEGTPLSPPSHRREKIRAGESEALAEYQRVRSDGHISGVTACFPSERWAKKVYPELSEDKALEQLWQDFIHIVRLDRPDPIQVWEQHRLQIAAQKEKLDALNIRRLHLTGPGTDLKIGMAHGSSWIGGSERNKRTGGLYTPNIPTEELFAVPHKDQTEGVVRATLPLNYEGKLINNFRLCFSKGLVTEWSAESGGEVLKSILDTDAGSRRLGEVALVPADSPIYQTGRIFYTTLFDENAVCHLALGRAYAASVRGGAESTSEARAQMGINDSGLHVDFMIGSEELDVRAETNQGELYLMKKGRWNI